MGAVPFVFGLVFSGFALVWLNLALAGMSRQGDHPFWWWGYLIPILFSFPFLAAGCIPMALGLCAMFGVTEIELNQKELRTVERIGFLRWTRAHTREGIRQFRISHTLVRHQNETSGVTRDTTSDFTRLYVEFGASKPFLLAGGYPDAWLKWVADALAARALPSYLAANPESHQPVLVENVTLGAADLVAGNVFTQPASSTITFSTEGERHVFTVPPLGVIKGSKGLFFFGLLWCCFMVVFSSCTVLGRLGDDSEPLFPWILFNIGFWGIGIGLLLGAFNMGKRRAMISVDPHQLAIAQITLFGHRKWEWSREQIKAIRLGPSGMEVNNRPVNELQIHPVVGKKMGIFSERDDDELRWLATQLRKTLQVAAD